MSLRRIGWLAMTALCLLFAPMAAEFYWVNNSGGLSTYARVLGVAVSESYAVGPGSGVAIMTPHWRSMPDPLQIVLGVHAALASAALCIGPFLFVDRLRASRRRLHRRLGRIYVGLVVVAMLLSMVYLTFTPFDRIYGGAPFAVGLWGISVLTLYTAVIGTWHIVRGEREAHRSVLLLNFAAMLIAPMLRLWWAVLGAVFAGSTQAQTHVVALMILGVQTFSGAIVVVHLTRRQVSAGAAIDRLRGHVLARLERLSWVGVGLGVGAGALALHQRLLRFVVAGWSPPRDAPNTLAEHALFAAHPEWFALEALALVGLFGLLPTCFRALYGGDGVSPRRLLAVAGLAATVAAAWTAQGVALWGVGAAAWGSASFALTLAAALLVCAGVLTYGVASRRADLVRAFALHVFALALAPSALLLFQVGFLAAGFGREDAFLSAGVLAPTLTLSVSYYYTAYGSRSRTGALRRDADRVSTERWLPLVPSGPR